MGDQINMLSHLSTLEISNVKRAANRKRYAITKSEIEMNIKQVLSVAAEGEEQFVATLKSENASPERIEAATVAYRLRKNCADLLKPEDLGVVEKAHQEPDGDEQGENETDEEFKARKAKKAASCKSESQTGIEPGFKPAKKSEEAPVEDPRIEALFKSNQALADQVKALVEKNDRLELESIAKSEFGHVPGSTEDLAKTLKAARDAGPETEKTVRAALKSINEMVSKSDHLNEVGTSGSGMAGGAYQKIEALAEGLTMKADNGKEMTKAQKIAHVIAKTAEGRALYEQYNEEKRQAIKRM